MTLFSAVNRSSGLSLFEDWFSSGYLNWDIEKANVLWDKQHLTKILLFSIWLLASLWVSVVYHRCFGLCFRSCSMSVCPCWVPSFLWVQWVLIHSLRAMRNAGKSPQLFTELDYVVLWNCAHLSLVNGWCLTISSLATGRIGEARKFVFYLHNSHWRALGVVLFFQVFSEIANFECAVWLLVKDLSVYCFSFCLFFPPSSHGLLLQLSSCMSFTMISVGSKVVFLCRMFALW